ncbi:hypothetical protein [Curtobacterium sp. 9128]|uniref:hypothetical protein n=1 Tax=Curtobacterium sp. 9128 TaxID=1793722 RepID=UPI0011A59BF0|nr:hypothetical protein [Curtobacterium sp. 9128]
MCPDHRTTSGPSRYLRRTFLALLAVDAVAAVVVVVASVSARAPLWVPIGSRLRRLEPPMVAPRDVEDHPTADRAGESEPTPS